MKLNHGGYDKKTTLEFFNSHIIPVDLLQRYTNIDGVFLLNSCGKPLEDGTVIEHIDTYLMEDKLHWRVQIHEIYYKRSLEKNWSTIQHAINNYGRYYVDKETGEIFYVDCFYWGICITHTFCIPYVETIPEFKTRKEREEWAKSILGI